MDVMIARLRRLLYRAVMVALVLWLAAMLAAIVNDVLYRAAPRRPRMDGPQIIVVAVFASLWAIIGVGAWLAALLDVLDQRRRGRGWTAAWLAFLVVGNVAAALVYFARHPPQRRPLPAEPRPRGGTPWPYRLVMWLVRREAAQRARTRKVPTMPPDDFADLHAAAFAGHLPAVRRLLAEGADVNGFDDRGRTPLVAAVRKPEVFRTLLEAGARVDLGIPLHEACRLGTRAEVRLLLERGADPNRVGPVLDSRPLHEAAARTDADVVADLIAAGAVVEAGNVVAATPLHVAAGRSTAAVVEVLLQAGADPNARDSAQETPLFRAIENQGERQAIVQRLQTGGADARAINRFGRGLLIEAARGPYADTVAALLALGLPVDQPDADGRTPLWYAAAAGRPDNLRLLLKHGATVDPVADGMTALMQALAQRHIAAAAVLVEAGANINARGPRGCVLDIALGSLDDLYFDRQVPPLDLDFARRLIAAGAVETALYREKMPAG